MFSGVISSVGGSPSKRKANSIAKAEISRQRQRVKPRRQRKSRQLRQRLCPAKPEGLFKGATAAHVARGPAKAVEPTLAFERALVYLA